VNAGGHPSATLPGTGANLAQWMAIEKILRLTRTILSTFALAFLYPFALADGLWLRVTTPPNGTSLAHARAAWLHRWSRVTCRVLGLRVNQRGFTPVSGVVTVNYTGLLDAILLAAVHPCVFVAGTEMRRRPIIGLLARIAGTLFIDHRRRHDTVRVNFMIQRAVQRRLLVVIFPGCEKSMVARVSAFASSLFQPASDLGCTLTAAAIDRRAEHARPIVTFSPPTFRRGGRKDLARLLHRELRDLIGYSGHAIL
jgi:hypothetical protein